MFCAYEDSAGYSPLMVVASEDGRVLAKLLGVVHSYSRFFPPFPLKRCEVFGTGEYFDSEYSREELFEQLLRRLTEEALRQAQFIEFRNIEAPLFGYRAFKANGYFAVHWLRVRNSLHSVQHAEDRFSSSRLREVKQGLKHGATAQEVGSADEVKRFARMLRKVYKTKLKRFFPRNDFFRAIRQRLASQGRCRIFTVCYNERIIGGSVCIYSGTDVYLWFSGGMYALYPKQYPGVLAAWKAMNDAKQRGYRHFEFMDVGLPFQRHGYRRFVLRFGGNQVSTRRWFRIRARWLNGIFRKLYE